MKNISLTTLRNYKNKGERFSTITSYDACFSHFICQAEIDVILVGDSLGMVLQGKDSTVPVTLDEMVYHTQCVKNGILQNQNFKPLLMSDLPFMTYGSESQALASSTALMQAGAEVVKLEGGSWLNPIVEKLSQRGIPVCVHLGLTPQSLHKLGGYKVQGKDDQQAELIFQDALAAETAGAEILLLECVPQNLAQKITESLQIPVIGIGAGRHTNSQVLVLHDMLGLNPGKPAKFVKDFLQDSKQGIPGALASFHQAVKTGSYPGPEHIFE